MRGHRRLEAMLLACGVNAQDACERAPSSSLQILHSSDHESSLQDPNTLEDKILHYAALQAGLRTLAEQACIPSLHLAAGDHTIPGPFYQAIVQDVQAQGDLSRTFVMVTNDFLSTDGDGYAALAAATQLETTTIGEQLIREQYIQQSLGGTVDLPEPLADPRVIRLDTP